jgi:hypothetical protein
MSGFSKFFSGLFKRQENQHGAMFRVQIELHQAETRYMYTWKLIAARRKRTPQDNLDLDRKVAAYVKSLNEVPPKTLGTKTIEQWM